MFVIDIRGLAPKPRALEPGEEPPPLRYESVKKPTLEEAQAFVGGLVEVVRLPGKPACQMLINEEGLFKRLPYNEAASKLFGGAIVGPALVLSRRAKW